MSFNTRIHANFKKDQLRYERVRTAYADKENLLKTEFYKKNIGYPPRNIFFRAFKKEKMLEVWVKNSKDNKYSFFKTYNFSAFSGDLGPKRQEGDGQIPEGFYYITGFNPVSNYYLSLKINYPNNSDKILGNRKNPGSDIFIHGSNVTIGCIPLTDDKIKELYLLTVESKENGNENISIHIFPTKMDAENFTELIKEYPQFKNFWTVLKDGYDYFEKEKIIPEISIKKNGDYEIKK